MSGSVRDGNSKSKRQARAVVAVGVALFAVLVIGQRLGWWGLESDAEIWTLLATDVYFLILGAVVIWKADGNRVGWVFCMVALFQLLSGMAEGMAELGLVSLVGVSGALYLSSFGVLVLGLLWYPDGKIPGPRWKWSEILAYGAFAVVFLASLTSEQVCLASAKGEGGGCSQWVDNPIGIPGVPHPEYGWLSAPLFGVVVILMVSSLVSLLVRYRRSGVVERLQLKWFQFACGAFVAGVLFETVSNEVFGLPDAWWLGIWNAIAWAAIPLAATVAILRYRLYDIDRIISRTVTYAVVAGLLAGGVALLAALVGTRFESPLVVAATTLAIAAVFNPLRRRVQVVVDRRFNRSRYDSERVMDQFAGSLRDRTDARDVVAGWLGVVSETMQPSSVGLWVRS